MFTGIVEELGEVVAARPDGLVVRGAVALDGLRVSDSIAVNGVCLTVVERDDDTFRVDVVPETLARTNLGRQRPGDAVNLERSMAADGRFGGHIVQGHVDCTGVVTGWEPAGNSVVITIGFPPAYARYIVPKGFIAVDGTSLTVVDALADTFTIALIPHTRERIALTRHGVGYVANLEVDIVGKYLERLVQDRLESLAHPAGLRTGGT